MTKLEACFKLRSCYGYPGASGTEVHVLAHGRAGNLERACAVL